MPRNESKATFTFENIPVVSFWDSISCLENEWGSVVSLDTRKDFFDASCKSLPGTSHLEKDWGSAVCDASLRSLPEEIVCSKDDIKEDLQASLASVAEMLPQGSGKLLSVNCENLAWATPCQTPTVCCSTLDTSGVDCASESEDSDCDSEAQVELPESAFVVKVKAVEDVNLESNAEIHRPSQSPHVQERFEPPPRRTSAKKSLQERATSMAPMLRAKHMDILDEQYLKDQGVRNMSDQTKRRPTSARGVRSTKLRQTPPVEALHSHVPAKISPSNARHAVQAPRQLGPHAIMPVVRGRLQVQAETVRHDNWKEARDAKLREQFRSKLSAVARPKSQARDTRIA